MSRRESADSIRSKLLDIINSTEGTITAKELGRMIDKCPKSFAGTLNKMAEDGVISSRKHGNQLTEYRKLSHIMPRQLNSVLWKGSWSAQA